MSPPLRQLALQFSAVIAVLSLAWPYYGLRSEALPWPQTALAIGAAGALLATITRQPWWWRIMHTLFAPLAWGVSLLEVDPGWFLLAFMLMLLVYRGALSGQVPLYLSNRSTAAALGTLLGDRPGLRAADIGAGIGSVLRPLAIRHPEARFTGIENAPLTWLVGRLLTLGHANIVWRMGSLWDAPLGDYDVVYAFLSPAPMPELWRKVQAEMPAGSLFVSNSFAVPDVTPSEIVEVGDGRQTQLYCYRL